MKKVLNPNFQAGSTRCNEPRLVCDILAELLASNSLFIKAFRQSAASHEDAAAEGQAADEDYAAVERKQTILLVLDGSVTQTYAWTLRHTCATTATRRLARTILACFAMIRTTITRLWRQD